MFVSRPRSKVYVAVQVVLQALAKINKRFVSGMQVALGLSPSHPAQRSFSHWGLRGLPFYWEYSFGEIRVMRRRKDDIDMEMR